MKLHRTMIFRDTDDDDFSPGWHLPHLPQFNNVLGFGVAHDLLEHGPRGKGTLEEECVAFGAMLWGRGGGGYWQKPGVTRTRFHQQVSYDLIKIMRESSARIKARVVHPRRHQLDDWVEEELASLEFSIWHDWGSDYDDVPALRTDEEVLQDAKIAIDWIRYGFRKAEKRFEYIGEYGFCDIFRQIESAPMVKDPENYGVIEGDVLHVTIDINNMNVRTHVTRNRQPL